MTSFFVVGLGGCFFLLGLGYIYRPDLVARVNSFLRESVFNDAQMKLERRKWGIFFLLVGFFFLYIGIGGCGAGR